MLRFAWPLIAAFAAFLPPSASAREKGDVILLINGDRITGEILKLQYGKLSLKTDSLGTVGIDWLDIARIQSPHSFLVDSNNGDSHSGVIAAAPEKGSYLIAGSSGNGDLPVTEVAMITQLDDVPVADPSANELQGLRPAG